MHHPTDRIAHTMAFVTPVVAGTRNSSMGPPHEGLIRWRKEGNILFNKALGHMVKDLSYKKKGDP